jgi:Inorganic pyrophosphatase
MILHRCFCLYKLHENLLTSAQQLITHHLFFFDMITVLHPWHGAHYGNKAPERVNGLIEISQGSRSKYEIDKDTGLLRLDRVIFSSFIYPVNYGFIPQTLGQDGDPLDVLVKQR